MQKLGFHVDIEPSLPHHAGDGLLALEDISEAIKKRVSDPQINNYFELPSARLSDALPHQGRFDVSEFGPYYDARTSETRPYSEHSLAIVANDIYVPGLNYLFGLTSPSYRASVVSVNRIVGGTRDIKLASQAVRVLARHEVGHQFGLKGIFDEDAGRDPLNDGHCDDKGCTMKQVMHPGELYALVEEQEGRDHFCDDCSEGLATEALRRVATLNGL